MPSFREIFFRPSIVELIVFFCASCTAQLKAGADDAAAEAEDRGVTRQASALLLEKNTSRQQAVTPMFAVLKFWRLLVVRAILEKSIFGGWKTVWDCSRTRTTSRGVTVCVSVD